MYIHCEKCSMDAMYLKTDSQGLIHYFCNHHAPEDALLIGTSQTTSSSFKKFLPLIIIFLTIIGITLFFSLRHGLFDLSFSMRIMMGSFFGIFGLFKIINLTSFAVAYQTYDLLAQRSSIYAYLYPFIEITLAGLYLFDYGGLTRDIVTCILMLVSALGVFIQLRKKENVPCACLGMVFPLPMTWVTLFEDLLMAGEALLMIILLN